MSRLSNTVVRARDRFGSGCRGEGALRSIEVQNVAHDFTQVMTSDEGTTGTKFSARQSTSFTSRNGVVTLKNATA